MNIQEKKLIVFNIVVSVHVKLKAASFSYTKWSPSLIIKIYLHFVFLYKSNQFVEYVKVVIGNIMVKKV